MLPTVIAIAEDAGKILLGYFKQDMRIDYKEGGAFDPVTEADLAADALIRERLRHAFPEDQQMTEEQKPMPIDYGKRVWIIDPLDGTKYFVRAMREFSVCIGLVDKGLPVLGVVHYPTSKTTLYGQLGKGAFRQDATGTSQIAVTTTETLRGITDIKRIDLGEQKRYDTLVARFLKDVKAKTIPGAGSAAKICMIAEGKADVLVNPSIDAKKWDTCAAHAILEAAGGRITNFDGTPLDYTKGSPVWKHSYMASNGVLHAQLIAELTKLEVD